MTNQNIFKLIRTIELFTNRAIIRWNKSFPSPVGISSILVLEQLQQNGPQKQSTLANQLGYTPGAMTNIANNLIKENYATREYSVNDRRVIFLVITAKGQQIVQDAQLQGQELRKELFEVLTEEEITQFLSIHEKLLVTLTKHRSDING